MLISTPEFSYIPNYKFFFPNFCPEMPNTEKSIKSGGKIQSKAKEKGSAYSMITLAGLFTSILNIKIRKNFPILNKTPQNYQLMHNGPC